MSLSNPSSLIAEETLNNFYKSILPYLGRESTSYMTKVLVAGDTTVTFDLKEYNGDYIVDFHISDESNYTSIEQTQDVVTLVFAPRLNNRTVCCEIKEV